MKITPVYILLAILLGGLSANAQSIYPGQHQGKIKLPIETPVKAYSFDLKDVRLLDSPFKQNMERESQWML